MTNLTLLNLFYHRKDLRATLSTGPNLDGTLILELLTHTFVFFRALHAAGAVSAGALESFSDGVDNLLIGIELDFHVRHIFLVY